MIFNREVRETKAQWEMKGSSLIAASWMVRYHGEMRTKERWIGGSLLELSKELSCHHIIISFLPPSLSSLSRGRHCTLTGSSSSFFFFSILCPAPLFFSLFIFLPPVNSFFYIIIIIIILIIIIITIKIKFKIYEWQLLSV
jgi:hypothetical protein